MSKCMTLTAGICRGCLDNVGGIKKLYFTNTKELYCAEPAFTPDTNVTDAIGDITFAAGATPPPFFKLEPSKNTANYVETINVSQENGTMYYNGVLTANYNKHETSKRGVAHELAKGDSTVIFVDGNNKYWLLTGLIDTSGLVAGLKLDGDNGCVLGGTSFQTGTAKADANGASLTFTCDMNMPAVELIKPASPAAGGIWDLLEAADAECAECE